MQLFGFPSGVSAEAVVQFLERHTGEESVHAVILRKNKSTGRYCGTVEFSSTEFAEYIISLTNTRSLWYQTSCLKARKMEHDIVPKPKTCSNSFQNIAALHFGCKQANKEKLQVLWSANNVLVDFGTGQRKVCVLVEHHGLDYRLRLPYENIWQIELRCPRRHTAKYLLIKLLGAPQIHKKDARFSGLLYEDPRMNFFRATPDDDQWVRATDFTPTCAISQSCTICLELPCAIQLPHFEENFACYKENEGEFMLETDSTFSFNHGPGSSSHCFSALGLDLPK